MHSWKKSLRSTTLAALLAFSSTTVALAAPNVTLNVHDGEVRDVLTAISALRSEERRVGKECRL